MLLWYDASVPSSSSPRDTDSTSTSQLAANPPPLTLVSLLSPEKTVNGTSTSSTLDSVLPTPAAPLFGFSSLLYTTTTRVPTAAIELRYKEAIAALSEQLGTDAWFLGSA
jgi:hypothetical protein